MSCHSERSEESVCIKLVFADLSLRLGDIMIGHFFCTPSFDVKYIMF